LIIHKLSIMGAIPYMPIYVDSPLGNKVTHLYEKYEDLINPDTIRYFRDEGIDPFNASFINYVKDNAESELVASQNERSIIISASGMCEGGHVRNHIKELSADKNSTILFVGYNANGTLGRRLQESSGTVNIDGTGYRVRCKIETVSGLSAHADLDYLINYIENCVASNPLKKIFLIHGDIDAIRNVKHILNGKGIDIAVIPELGKQYKL
jgi:metallo-beta-lactamase family protein